MDWDSADTQREIIKEQIAKEKRAAECEAIVRELARMFPWHAARDGWRCRHCSWWMGPFEEIPFLNTSDVEYAIAQHDSSCPWLRARDLVSR